MDSKNYKLSIWLVVFDLNTVKFKELFPNDNVCNKYDLIKKFFESNDFNHIQGSVYISKDKISKFKLLGTISNLFYKEPNLYKYVKKLAFAELESFDLVFNSKEEIKDFFDPNENFKNFNLDSDFSEDESIEDDFEEDIKPKKKKKDKGKEL